eukprot:gene5446-621_t
MGTTAILAEEEFLEKYHEQRRVNLRLLSEKRELLMQLQKATGAQETKQIRSSEDYEKLKQKVEELEKQLKERKENFTITPSETSPGAELIQSSSTISKPPESECNCTCADKLQEAIAVNHQWNSSYQRLLKRFTEMDRKVKKLEEQLKVETEENNQLKDLVNKLENDFGDYSRQYARLSSLEEVCSKDDVEALKIQLLAYKEDFFTEKEEKEKIIYEDTKLKKDLEEANRIIKILSEQVGQYKSFATKISKAEDSLERDNQWNFSEYSYPAPIYRRQLSPSYSLPMTREVPLPRGAERSTNFEFRRSDPDLFRGGKVVRD